MWFTESRKRDFLRRACHKLTLNSVGVRPGLQAKSARWDRRVRRGLQGLKGRRARKDHGGRPVRQGPKGWQVRWEQLGRKVRKGRLVPRDQLV